MSGGKYADRCNLCGKYSVPYNNIIDRILNPCIDITFNISLRKIFRLWNNKILIIIFVGENNTAIYNPVCVRVVKNNDRFILRKISDKINVDINKGMRFFVYLGDEKIGEGTIL